MFGHNFQDDGTAETCRAPGAPERRSGVPVSPSSAVPRADVRHPHVGS